MKVLLTGDDGYKALGIRIVNQILREKGFEVFLTGTQQPRSSTGGSFPGKGRWGRDSVDGTPALWVDGMPADSVELALYVLGSDFDLIVSGANLGENIGLIPASGTIHAALHGLDKALAPRAMAISWDSPETFEHQDNTQMPLADYQAHPKQTISKLIDLALEHDFWNAQFLNFNVPRQTPSELMICSPTTQPYASFYGFTMKVDEASGSYEKIPGPSKTITEETHEDGRALMQGFATVVPWLANRYVDEHLLQLVGTRIPL